MALKFIHTADYADIINTEELDVISNSNADTIASAEKKAISKVKKYLLRKYDTDTLFTAIDDTDVGTTNDTRDITLVEYCIYFTLYILYTRIAKRNVPEDRYEQYKEARDFFKDVQQDMITPGWPLLLNADGETESPGVRMWSGHSDDYYY
ncbi:hypothetical protein [Reichenbachiella sp.]|uniref:hypothetical protein n=1 Tax=Reichenbachiella sp. TaxID=2184521 RepID=UPI003B59E4D2